MLRNLLGAVTALIVTILTTQTIVHATPRPYLAAAVLPVQADTLGTARLAQCTGRSNRVC
ncbi:MAG TPA: hypothetical protein VN859_06565 [Steroidobacteraceae bacterium]|nr:hypothetical protein [Steroidobacteraceae bacterium]